ncbi:sensor domain-containing diguanylate cyclase [Paralcaligenes sp. KSB-10]|uniref:sensor domain-containing diguanylate cyclase n=1 Tax=Paralcaligenes sp. KSB-10 TaxID=2901142 RepID=UPI001E4F2188|nr:diguanylate cyclase [Paralcaligenes sp. KSB-10]UHL63488.1 sensor domain-containing diguanylate cyclase [Paralcaligenes sp. KSB-10]
MKYFFSVFVVLIGLFSVSPAAAGDLIVSSAILEDSGGNLTIADIVGRKFIPFNRKVSKGYTDSVHWVRLRVRAPAQGSEVVLHIGSSFLDDVRLYEASDSNPLEWVTRVTGDKYAYNQRDRVAIALGFVVNVTAPEQTFYLRIQTTSESLLNIEALEPHEALRKEQKSGFLRDIFMGLMLWALVWAIDHYIVDRQPTVGLFGLYQAVYILYGLSITGYFAPFVPDGSPQMADWLTNILTCGVPFMFILFSRALFRLYVPAPMLMRGLNLFLLIFPVQLAAMATGHTLAAIGISALLSLAAVWYCVIVAFSARKEQAPSLRFLRATYIVLALFATDSILASFGWWATWEVSSSEEWELITQGVVSSVLICSMLYMRLRQLRRDAQESAVALVLSQKTLELERAYKEEAEIHARTDYLTGVFNRRYFVELVGRELARALRSKEPLSLLMIDIDHFKAVNDMWGHSGGDTVLRKVAQVIRGVLREVDVFGRIGGEEFAAVLIGADIEHALEIAQRLRTEVADAVIALAQGGQVRVTVSLGLTELMGRDIDLDGLLHEADEALYKAKRSGRNCVVVADEGVGT